MKDPISSDEKLSEFLHDEFAEKIIKGLYALIKETGIPQRLLLDEKEAAYVLHFSETAMHQAEWQKEIPVARIGVKKFYRLKDLETFVTNHMVTPLPPQRKPVRSSGTTSPEPSQARTRQG